VCKEKEAGAGGMYSGQKGKTPPITLGGEKMIEKGKEISKGGITFRSQAGAVSTLKGQKHGRRVWWGGNGYSLDIVDQEQTLRL